ncbi:MAG: sigma-70 family RNA polymerase sigma factor [Armatimonas sp.]
MKQEAFQTLYRRHGRDVLGILLRLTHGNRAEAEDLTQETFLAALRGWKTFRGDGTARAWLVGIAVRRWRDAARKPQPTTTDSEVLYPKIASPEHVTLARLDLDAALNQLPEAQRIALLLVLGQGLTYREAAESLGEPVGTIKWRVHEATKTMRDLLSEEEAL